MEPIQGIKTLTNSTKLMKASCRTVVFIAGLGLCLMTHRALASPVDLSAPSAEVGVSNLHGYLEVWREINEVGIQLGKDSYLPLRYKFSSEPNVGGILGAGFYLPMFECRNVLIREKMMKSFLPCGKVLYLRRDNSDPNKFQTLDQTWTGYLTNDDNFVMWRNDGWKLVYYKGLLSSLTSDDNQTFSWSYDNGMPRSVSENGQPLITIEPNATGQVAAFIFNGKRYEVEYAERPLTQILMGQVAIKELDQALSTFKYPDGKADVFKFVLTSDRVPTLTFTDRNGQQMNYTWDAATSHIVTEKGPEDEWTYKVGDVTEDFALPAISRTNSSGKTEGMDLDIKMGTYTALGIDGLTTVTHVFETPGPLYNKVQKIDKIRKINGKDIATTVYKASYDELGRLIRQTDENGFKINYTYDDQDKLIGKQLIPTDDAHVLGELKKKESQFLRAITEAKSNNDRQLALQRMGIFYVDEMKDASKALALAPQLTDKHRLYIVKEIALNHDESMGYKQKIDGYVQLEKEFPNEKENLDFLIRESQKMADAGLY